jgi:paraquat-inducible protein B
MYEILFILIIFTLFSFLYYIKIEIENQIDDLKRNVDKKIKFEINIANDNINKQIARTENAVENEVEKMITKVEFISDHVDTILTSEIIKMRTTISNETDKYSKELKENMNMVKKTYKLIRMQDNTISKLNSIIHKKNKTIQKLREANG